MESEKRNPMRAAANPTQQGVNPKLLFGAEGPRRIRTTRIPRGEQIHMAWGPKHGMLFSVSQTGLTVTKKKKSSCRDLSGWKQGRMSQQGKKVRRHAATKKQKRIDGARRRGARSGVLKVGLTEKRKNKPTWRKGERRRVADCVV